MFLAPYSRLQASGAPNLVKFSGPSGVRLSLNQAVHALSPSPLGPIPLPPSPTPTPTPTSTPATATEPPAASLYQHNSPHFARTFHIHSHSLSLFPSYPLPLWHLIQTITGTQLDLLAIPAYQPSTDESPILDSLHWRVAHTPCLDRRISRSCIRPFTPFQFLFECLPTLYHSSFTPRPVDWLKPRIPFLRWLHSSCTLPQKISLHPRFFWPSEPISTSLFNAVLTSPSTVGPPFEGACYSHSSLDSLAQMHACSGSTQAGARRRKLKQTCGAHGVRCSVDIREGRS